MSLSQKILNAAMTYISEQGETDPEMDVAYSVLVDHDVRMRRLVEEKDREIKKLTVLLKEWEADSVCREAYDGVVVQRNRALEEIKRLTPVNAVFNK